MYLEPRGLDSSPLARDFSLCTTFHGEQFGAVGVMEIAASCIAFAQVADKTIRTIRGFIIDCRDARGDLSAVNRELSELKLTLNILEDLVPDGSQTEDPLPSSIRDDIRDIIKNCLDAAKDIDDVLVEHRGRFAAVSWAATGKQNVNSLKAVLEAHRRALNLAVDTITLAMTKSIKNDTEDILEDTSDIKQDTADIKEDTTKILEEIARLETLIRRNIPAESSKMFLLNRYLYDLTSVAGSVCGDLSRPGSPESISERSSTLIATETASNYDVWREPEANKLKCGWNFSDDGRHIVSFFNIRSNPVVETWNFKDELATEGALWPKYQQSEEESYSLKPHTHPNGKACNCFVGSVAMADNLVVVVSSVYKPQISPLVDYFVTGWKLGTGKVVFCHVLGTWELGDSFTAKLSRDAKILRISRKANAEEEKEWRKFRDFKSACLHSTLEIDGPDLRLVQNYAIFDNDDLNAMEKDIGRTFFLSMVKPAEEGRLSSWVFDCVFNLNRVNVSRQKMRKWVQAPIQNYDGDDWGADEFEDDEPPRG
ncbi:hypothetical protein Neosp_001403 [[Neocosmospora] mangrovei]